MKPKTMILRSAGTNCDEETAYAFELAGATAQKVHVNRLMENPELLHEFQLLAIPGGFSYGDDIAAGRILANQITHHLHDALHRFVEDGHPVIGICNGFQVLVKTDLLPGPLGGRSGPFDQLRAGQTCTLTNNDCGHFVDRWIRLARRSDQCIWTVGIEELPLPVAHGEGKFVAADEGIRESLWNRDQVALVYVTPDGLPAKGRFPDNPNGSLDDIAGVCDESGIVLGLMPHPERFVAATQHPGWTNRLDRSDKGDGLRVFQNAVRHASAAIGSGI
ncbi:MAG TPA: phosphoribosylformylglycinamidine synthase I [Tepidisphaeraceae bacterium]|nr:phosphoribosylformylglycinamidine synthase I [Tepidisphaeraceae bacterium]